MIINRTNISDIENEAFKNEFLIPLPFSYYNNLSKDSLRYFMYIHGIYVLPTIELINFLKENIVEKTIEIGSGLGCIGRSLNIPKTDSKLQDEPEIKAYYKLVNQPTINYPNDIEKLDAISAIDKYSPDTVIGAFITHKYREDLKSGNMYGVEEEKILEKTKLYINIGNLDTHKDKPILKLKHESLYFDWLITRSENQKNNRIFIFKK
jgi:hypothetical protein